MYRTKITNIRLVLLFTTLLFFAGCATMQTIDISKRSQKYATDFLSTYKAVAAYCNEKGFAITMADKDLGIINTDYKENDGLSKFLTGNHRTKLNFTIKKLSDAETNVVVTASAEEQGAFGSWKQSTMTENQAAELYQKIFAGIKSQIGK